MTKRSPLRLRSRLTDRAQADATPRASEGQYRLLFELNPNPMWIFDAATLRFLAVNGAAVKLYGWSREEFLRLTVNDIRPREEVPRLARALEGLRNSQATFAGEWRHLKKNGVVFDVEVIVSTIQFEGRNARLTMVNDITKRKQAEAALRQSEARLKADLDATKKLAGLGMLIAREGDLKSVLRAVVDAAIGITGADFGNIQLLDPASGDLKIVAQRSFPKWWVDYRNDVSRGHGVCGTALERAKRVIVEDVEQSPIFVGTNALQMQRKAGVRAVQSTPLVSRSGKVLGMFSTHYRTPGRPDPPALRLLDLLARQAADLIEHVQAEAALRQQRGLLESVMRTTDVMLVLLDPQFNYVWVNEAYARTCRMPAESMVGKNHFALYPSKENETIFRKVRDTGKAVFYKDKPYAFPDEPKRGMTYWDWSLSPVRGAGGPVAGLVFSLRETTKFKQAEFALQMSEERLLLAQQSAGAGVWDWDISANRLVWSPELFRLFGLDPAKAKVGFATWRSVLHPKDRLAAAARVRAAGRRPGRFLNEYRIVLPSGETRWINSIGDTAFDDRGRALRMSGICLDVTERKHLEETQRKLNRTFQALGHSSQALLGTADEKAYLRDVCRIIVQDCGHALVWVGFAQNDQARGIQVAAYAGFEKGYLETLKLTWAKRPRGRGPTGTAIRTGRVCLCRNMLTDPKFRPWRREAVRRGYASSISLPLHAGGRAFGALTIYSKQPDAFSADEVKLLTELAASFAQGITTLRLRRAREQAETALRESEERYRGLVETQTELICRFKPDGTLTFVNEACCRYFRRTRKELIGRKFLPLVPTEERRVMREHLAALSPRRPLVSREYRVIAPNGEIRWQRWNNQAFFDAQKRLTELQAVGRDITSRKQAEEALRESEERYRRLFEDDLTGNFLATPAGNIQFCNPAFVKIYGFSSRRSAARGNLARFNPGEWPRLVETLRARGRVDRHRTSQRTVDGRQIHIVENLVGVFNRQKELVQIRGYVFDDTERKQADEELRLLNATLERRVAARNAELTDAYERLRAIMDNALVGILTLDERGSIESFNPAAAAIFGYPPDEMGGLNARQLMASSSQMPGGEFLAHCLSPGELRFTGAGREILGRRKDGHVIMLELTASDFTDRGRRQFVVMVRDVTRRKQLERELLEVGDRERQRIGHDLHDGLGQHLHALYYIATLLHRELKSKSPPHAPEAARLSRLIGEALDLARSLARGLQPVNPVPEGLMATLRELAQRTRALYRVDCRFECHAPVLVHRHTAANHLYRIAQEAVNNAVKHGRPMRIRIRLAATPQNIVLGIRDDGVGISHRAARSRGMGLHVMQYRADAINGSLLVQRHPAGGTEVACTVKRQSLLQPDDDFK